MINLAQSITAKKKKKNLIMIASPRLYRWIFIFKKIKSMGPP